MLVAAFGQVHGSTAAQTSGSGTIQGTVRLTGPAPANPIIRMGADPRCSKLYAGKRLTQETVLRSADGGLANAFVYVQGTFPETPAPSEPVIINQQGCIYRPHVMGARVGQTLQIQNSDPTLHNLHSLSGRGNAFNVSQPSTGMVFKYALKNEEVMLHIKCDVHSWMHTYVGIVKSPYFAVSGETGTFRIANVPAGKYPLQTWHERYGPMMQSVDVRAGATATVDFTYTGTEKPRPTAGLRVQELIVSGL
jgi:hypothetical protein